MKKTISILMALTMILLVFVSCGKTDTAIKTGINTNDIDTAKNDETMGESDKTEDENTNETTESGIVPSNGGEGVTGELYYNNYIDSIPSEFFVDGDTELSAILPVYTYPYGYGQAGPLYINDEDLVADTENKLRGFVSVLYDEQTAAESEITTKDYMDYYDYSDLPYSMRTYTDIGEVFALVDTVTIILDTEIPGSVMTGDYKSNDIIAACLEYMNFTSPMVVSLTEPNFITYSIYDFDSKKLDFDNLSSFRCISVLVYEDMISSIRMTDIQFDEKYGDYQTVSYDTALGMVKEEYPEIDPDKVSAVRIWKYSYDQDPLGTESKGMGYYFPCYRFYIQDPAGDSEGVDIVDVSMTTFDIMDFYT